MSANRLTARFSDEEIRKIEAHASVLGMTKSDVLRCGVEQLFSTERLTARLAEMREQLGDDMRVEFSARMSKIAEQNRKTATLLLMVLKAPQEAQQTLSEIFKD